METWPIYRVMGPDANDEDRVPDPVKVKIYEDMVLLRTFDEKTITLQRQGRVGTFPPSIGQEASEIASAHALSKEDWLAPSYRDHGALYVHGVPFENVILFAMGKASSISGQVRALPTSIPIATHLPHAVGLAWAARRQGEAVVAMAYFGDGGTSEGDFHEALNFAGVLKAPVIFFCQNNGWAISVPVRWQTASPTLAQKALAYGVHGQRVDGNDALAVYQAVKAARERALAGEGPTLIEALTYRLGPHTTADDPSRYRPLEEWEVWRQRDPLVRLGRYLAERGLLSEAEQAAIQERARAWINRAVEAAEATPPVDPTAMFRYLYAEPPPRLLAQMQALQEEIG
ncbi:MAG: pyruvate dehydrogenase (acetyl-transferring) E1 component subunit alpha [Firmicutes bacterium]|nr:pyruvate dehydrogenase (acetyl-transferring) E1 component subunit alpha [Alicyclobacillaceae bacterium]MCL6498093.1 pyruvate dehydrogenase (acetyl-transferring) E1 component subunit alpha [Bacillota bacterium]